MLTIFSLFELVRTPSLTLSSPLLSELGIAKDANTVTASKYRLNRNRQLPPKYYVQAQELDKFYIQDYVWSVVSLTLTYTQNILFHFHHVIVMTLKALIIFFFAILDRLQAGTLTDMITHRHNLPMNFYMVKTLQQMKRIK